MLPARAQAHATTAATIRQPKEARDLIPPRAIYRTRLFDVAAKSQIG
jgi:hypothetical protein